MDGLALLCNLCADGPVTLRRLRAARVPSLNELERATPERLAAWLHASVPQARAFIEEARKLVRRLAESTPRALTSPPRQAERAVANARTPSTGARAEHRTPDSSRGAKVLALVPGLIPGLDESVCSRLSLNQVRTVQALCESAGLALARRTGIPYSTLLDLARRARRLLPCQAHPAALSAPLATVERELVPFVLHPRPPAERELVPSDGFTLPAAEPESAGPFV